MHKNTMKCDKTLSKWCKNKHGASKIIDTFETYQVFMEEKSRPPAMPENSPWAPQTTTTPPQKQHTIKLMNRSA
jgi:hypothetical protein